VTSTSSPLELSASERNTFLLATIRQTLLWPRLRAALTADELTELGRYLAAGEVELNLDLGREISREEMREFMRYMTAGQQSYEGYDAEDFVMSLLLKALSDPPDFLLPELGQNTDAWLRSVVLNAKRDAVRAENRHERILHHAALNPGSWFSTARRSESPERIVLRHLDHLENLRRIGRLPKNLGDVAYLRYEGYSIQETAQALGVSYNTAQLRLQRIRSKKVRRVLGL
jgi:RNA polymerase sigma factor (sigma-70 family)